MNRPALVLLLVLLAGCMRDADAPAPGGAEQAQPAAAEQALADVIETTPGYIIGISYPEAAKRHPALAKELRAYAERVRADLMRAVAAQGGRKPEVPFDLSLQFTGLVETPRLVAIGADGSSFTGGAHATPLVERFVWLPAEGRLLTVEDLLPDPAAWPVLSGYAREQLMTALSARIDDDALEGVDRADALKSGSALIDAGTGPEARNFSRFEPVMNADGAIRALRFVFPATQVAAYEDGTRTVDVPAEVLLPLVAPAYRALFRAG